VVGDRAARCCKIDGLVVLDLEWSEITMKRSFGRSAAIGMFAICVAMLNTGCIDRIGQWALNGFGFSLGGIPATIVSGFITSAVGGLLGGLTGQ
jgi:hypothetical protein